jgi:hypothetical protein
MQHSVQLRSIGTICQPAKPVIYSGTNLPDTTTEVILSVLNADTWDAIRNVVEENRSYLLAEVADVALADLVMQPSTDEERSHTYLADGTWFKIAVNWA